MDDSCVVINSLLEEKVEIKEDCVITHCNINVSTVTSECCLI